MIGRLSPAHAVGGWCLSMRPLLSEVCLSKSGFGWNSAFTRALPETTPRAGPADGGSGSRRCFPGQIAYRSIPSNWSLGISGFISRARRSFSTFASLSVMSDSTTPPWGPPHPLAVRGMNVRQRATKTAAGRSRRAGGGRKVTHLLSRIEVEGPGHPSREPSGEIILAGPPPVGHSTAAVIDRNQGTSQPFHEDSSSSVRRDDPRQ